MNLVISRKAEWFAYDNWNMVLGASSFNAAAGDVGVKVVSGRPVTWGRKIARMGNPVVILKG